MKPLLIISLIVIFNFAVAQNIQKVSSGKIDHIENFPSKLVENVWTLIGSLFRDR